MQAVSRERGGQSLWCAHRRGDGGAGGLGGRGVCVKCKQAPVGRKELVSKKKKGALAGLGRVTL